MTKTSETGQFRLLKLILHLEILFRIFATKRRATLLLCRFFFPCPKVIQKQRKSERGKWLNECSYEWVSICMKDMGWLRLVGSTKL